MAQCRAEAVHEPRPHAPAAVAQVRPRVLEGGLEFVIDGHQRDQHAERALADGHLAVA